MRLPDWFVIRPDCPPGYVWVWVPELCIPAHLEKFSFTRKKGPKGMVWVMMLQKDPEYELRRESNRLLRQVARGVYG